MGLRGKLQKSYLLKMVFIFCLNFEPGCVKLLLYIFKVLTVALEVC